MGAALAAVAAVLVIGTASDTIRWRLPDQRAMRSYLEGAPFDAFAQLSHPVTHNDGENRHLCFMCSTYGVTQSYTLTPISTEPAQRAFCDEVEANLDDWQGGSQNVVSEGYVPDNQSCSFTVPTVRGNGRWRMTVVVAFQTFDNGYVQEPPRLIVGLEDTTA